MIKCSMCGAENRHDVDTCRMCASPLRSAPIGAETQATSKVTSATIATSIQPTPFINCPVCQTPNEAEWDFCQQCGSRIKTKPKPVEELRAIRQDATQVSMAAIPIAPPRADPAPPAATADRCSKCGAQLPAGSSFCFKCGAPSSIARTVVMTSVPKQVNARLVLIMEGNQRGDSYDLKDETLIGRSSGQITFPHDEFMSGHHARIERKNSKFVLTDEGSRNGTFIRITGEVELKPGDTILIGKQLFRLEM